MTESRPKPQAAEVVSRRGDSLPNTNDVAPPGKDRAGARSRDPEGREWRTETAPLDPTLPISRSPVVAHNCEHQDLIFLVKPHFSHSGGALLSVGPHLPESILPVHSEDREAFAPLRLPRVSRPPDPRDHRDFSRVSQQAQPAYPTAIQTLDEKAAQCFPCRQYIRGAPAGLQRYRSRRQKPSQRR